MAGKVKVVGGVEKLRNIILELGDFFKEREELAKLLALALLSKQHVYILGPPGTAKSAMARAVAAHLDAKYFEYLLGRYTTPEELFGPLDLSKLEEGLFVRVTTAKLPEAEIAFLDEVFKANSAILNTLLEVINNRVYHEGERVVDVPLNTLITASNELPEDDEELAAFYDRLLIRYVVDYIKDDRNFKGMLLTDEEYVPKTKISIGELRAMQKQASKVDITPILDTVVELRKNLKRAGIVASDRRFKQAMSVVRAHAFLQGRAVATTDDLRVLLHIMWDTPEQVSAVRKVVMDVVDPFARRIMEYREIVDDYKERMQGKLNAAEVQEIMSKLKLVENEINELSKMALGSGRDASELEEILDEVQSLKVSMLDKMF